MKRIMVVLLILVLCTSCSFFDQKEPVELSIPEVLEKLNNENTNSFLLYIRTDHCYSCDEYEKVIKEVEDETPFEVYYTHIDLTNVDPQMQKSLEELKVTIGDIEQLPTTYYFYQGSLLDENKKPGYMEKKDLITWLKNLHIIH